MVVHGLLLAAGAGRRMGTPKALMHDPDGASWLARTVAALRDGGCDRILVVLGAAERQARALLDGHDVDVVVAQDWDDGMGASLRAGLLTLEGTAADAVLVTLVDLPDVGPAVVRRLLNTGGCGLARAAYAGEPGHPVLIARSHWPGVADAARGDRGARDYLATHEVVLVECGDLATGQDRDR